MKKLIEKLLHLNECDLKVALHLYNGRDNDDDVTQQMKATITQTENLLSILRRFPETTSREDFEEALKSRSLTKEQLEFVCDLTLISLGTWDIATGDSEMEQLDFCMKEIWEPAFKNSSNNDSAAVEQGFQ